MDDGATASAHRLLRIRGRVQGVGYRLSLAHQAQCLGVAGWVRNRLDGSVEAEVVGPASAVQALIAWAHQGPPLAVVTAVEVGQPEGDLSEVRGFEQLPTV